MALAAGGIPAAAAPPGPDEPADSPSPAVAGSAATVTLVTGDRVQYRPTADGTGEVRFLAGPRGDGREVSFRSVRHGEHLYVIPSDVAHLVPGKLDLRLFDVPALVEAGYDDAHVAGLPIIVQTTKARASARGAQSGQAAPDWSEWGVEPERTLESISAVSAEATPEGAPALLAALEAAPASTPKARAATAAPVIEKIWLDGRTEALLDGSAAQVGAPQAWAAGHDGTGTTVAVLDTGVDATHPDLDGGVVALEKNFTDSSGAGDLFGHGTHVASTIAGSGEASGGTYRGVAPGAKILNGKVLDDDGYGLDSWIIDGIEWAAAEGADVANLSLGSAEYTDGTDPLSLAVDAVSATSDMLVVAAAGNDGASDTGTIGAPAAADSALTVGAVDDGDVTTWFSSTGPRYGDGAIKPDVAAPGEAIVAARAAGTGMDSPVDDFYTAASGTSMATPHVAGAAAVLKAARPGLDGEALKAVLMGSAQPVGNPVFAEGSGRLWIPGALDQQVTTEPASLSIGAFEFPQDGTAPSSHTLTYRNASDADVVLDLALDVTARSGGAVPDGLVTTSVDTVTVPAGGKASVDVVVAPARGGVDVFSGALTATAAGGTSVRTVLAFQNEPQMRDLRIEATRDGAPVGGGSSFAVLAGVTDPSLFRFLSFTDGVSTLRVPEGEYVVQGAIVEEWADGDMERATLFDRDAVVTADTTVALDLGGAVEVRARTAERTVPAADALEVERTVGDMSTSVAFLGFESDSSFAALPSGGRLAGEARLSAVLVRDEPLLDATVRGAGRSVDLTSTARYATAKKYVGDLSLSLVDAGHGTAAELGQVAARDAVVLVREGGALTLAEKAANARAAGARLVVAYGDVPGPYADYAGTSRVPVVTVPHDVGLRLVRLAAKGGAVASGTGAEKADYQYRLAHGEPGGAPDRSVTIRATPKTTASVSVRTRAAFRGQTTVEGFSTNASSWGLGFGHEGPSRQEVRYLAQPGLTFTGFAEAETGTDDDVWPSMVEGPATTYRPGQRLTQTFHGSVIHGGFAPGSPEGATSSSVHRDRNALFAMLPARVDGDGHAAWPGVDAPEVTTGRFRLWQGSTLLVDAKGETGSWDPVKLPRATTDYRMRLDMKRQATWWPRSTSVSTEWGFSSARTSRPTTLPLLQLDYGVRGLDGYNVGARRTVLDLAVTHQDGSRGGTVKGARLWWSSDGGTTWHAAKVTRQGDGRYRATVSVPRGVTSVSLKAKAWDSKGSTIKETVIDAYGVK